MTHRLVKIRKGSGELLRDVPPIDIKWNDAFIFRWRDVLRDDRLEETVLGAVIDCDELEYDTQDEILTLFANREAETEEILFAQLKRDAQK